MSPLRPSAIVRFNIMSTVVSSRLAHMLRRTESTDDESVGRQLAVGAFGNLVLNVTAVVSNLLIAVFLARGLGPRGYGVYAIATTWAMLLTVVALLGLSPLVIRKVAEYRDRDAWGLVRGLIRSANLTVLTMSLVCSTAAGLIGWFFYRSNGGLLHAYLLALLLIPLTAIQSLRQAVLAGLGRTVLARVPPVLVSTGGFMVVLGVVALLPVRLSPAMAVGLNAATTGLAFLVSTLLLIRLLPRAARTAVRVYESRDWRRSALPLLISSGVQTLNAQAGLILLAILKPAADAGRYGISMKAATTISFLLLTVSYPAGPAIARLYARRELHLVQRVVSQSARAVAWLTLPFAVAMFVFAAPILRVFFGAGFESGSILLRILAGGEVVNVVTGLSGQVLLMTGYEAKWAKGVAAGAVTTFGVGLGLTPAYGALGAAIATTAGGIVSNVVLAISAWRSVRIYTLAIRSRWLGIVVAEP